jgi:hypothetical protein
MNFIAICNERSVVMENDQLSGLMAYPGEGLQPIQQFLAHFLDGRSEIQVPPFSLGMGKDILGNPVSWIWPAGKPVTRFHDPDRVRYQILIAA